MISRYDQEGPVLAPGTIVLQSISDTQYYVAVVAGDKFRDRLMDKEDIAEYARYTKAVHILLVLGAFGFRQPVQGVFDYPERVFTFPTYATGICRTATVTDLKEEIALCRLHAGDQAAGLRQGWSNRRAIFGFGNRLKEILAAVAFVQHYINGGCVEDRPGQPYLGEDGAKALYSELTQIIPR